MAGWHERNREGDQIYLFGMFSFSLQMAQLMTVL